MVTFDPAKDRSNLAKHGISLADAGLFEWSTALIIEDRSGDYGERREIAVGFVGNALCVYVYTLRGDEDHAISLRKATRQEARRYAEEHA